MVKLFVGLGANFPLIGKGDMRSQIMNRFALIELQMTCVALVTEVFQKYTYSLW